MVDSTILAGRATLFIIGLFAVAKILDSGDDKYAFKRLNRILIDCQNFRSRFQEHKSSFLQLYDRIMESTGESLEITPCMISKPV